MGFEYRPLASDLPPAMRMTHTWNERLIGLLDLLEADTSVMREGEVVLGDSCSDFIEVIEEALPNIRINPEVGDWNYFTLANLEATPADALTLSQVPEAKEKLLAFLALCRSPFGFVTLA